MRVSLLMNILFMALLFSSISYGQYYYGSDGIVNLGIDSSKVSIKFENTISPNSQASAISSIERIQGSVNDYRAFDNFIVCSLYTGSNYQGFLDSLRGTGLFDKVEPFYITDLGHPFLVGEQFVVAFEESITESDVEELIVSYGVTLESKIYGTESIYVLKNSNSSDILTIDLANTFHQMEDVIFSHPNFGFHPEVSAYKAFDYYRDFQDNIKKVTGDYDASYKVPWGPNSNTVWDFAGLENYEVVVAVVDQGIDYDNNVHIDLPASRMVPGYDFVYDDDKPYPVTDRGHGMGCAGIIAASHTTDPMYDTLNLTITGVISLNPYAKIMPIKIFGERGPLEPVINAAGIANAFLWASQNGADVLSNSWVYNVPTAGYPVIDTAIAECYRNGRNGLGNPIIFSAGNFADYFPGYVAYPGRLSYCFAVGALELDDDRWWYSQYGDHLDAMAPSGDVGLQGDIWTLDRKYIFGYNYYDTSITWDCPWVQNNDIDYNCHFGGTSAAAPIASGIASLLIARDSTLTVEEVYDILKYTAVTELDNGHTVNAPDLEYGYGRVDAYRAMLAITRGDADNSGKINLGDAVYIINYVHKHLSAPKPHLLTGDANCDGHVNIGDAIFLVNFIFKGGPAPEICYELDNY